MLEKTHIELGHNINVQKNTGVTVQYLYDSLVVPNTYSNAGASVALSESALCKAEELFHSFVPSNTTTYVTGWDYGPSINCINNATF